MIKINTAGVLQQQLIIMLQQLLLLIMPLLSLLMMLINVENHSSQLLRLSLKLKVKESVKVIISFIDVRGAMYRSNACLQAGNKMTGNCWKVKLLPIIYVYLILV